MKPLRNHTTGYLHTALAVAAFLMASQTAGASVISVSFTLSPLDALMAQGVSGGFEVDLTNTGSSPEQFGSFRFGLTTNIPGITFDSVKTGTQAHTPPYIFPYSNYGSNIALTLNPDLTAMDSTGFGYTILGPGASVELGYVTYHVNGDATPGSVIKISFAPPGVDAGTWLGDTTNLNAPGYTFDAADLVGGTVTVATDTVPTPEPDGLLPVGLFLVGLGVFGRRMTRDAKKRRSIPGIRKPSGYEARAPDSAKPRGPCVVA